MSAVRLTFVAVLALAFPGCSTPVRSDAGPSPAAACLVPGGESAAAGQDQYFQQNRQGDTRLAGLPPLIQDTLPPAVRELRLWHVASWVGATSLLRVQTVGDSVTGQLISFAGSVIDTPEGADALLPDACRLLARGPGRLACEATVTNTVDWSVVLDSLEAHRVWTLPPSSVLPPRQHGVTDGHGIYVEIREGRCYRMYDYGNPQTESTLEYRDAAALLQIVLRLRGDRSTGSGPASR